MFIVKLPTIGNTLAADDYQQYYFMLGAPALHEKGVPHTAGQPSFAEVLTHFFAFADGNAEKIQAAKHYGIVPWWADDDLKVHFFRPVSVFTHWLDYQLWPELPVMMHLHNLVWFVLCIAVLSLLFRPLLPSYAVGSLALLFYALDPSFSTAVFWIANRNAVIAVVFSVLCFHFYRRWREENAGPGLFVMSFAMLLLSLFAAEAGLATMAFLFAYEFTLAKDSIKRRVLAIAPFVVAVGLWRYWYTQQGFGAQGSGLYIDPSDLPAFLTNMIANVPLLVFQQFLGYDGIDQFFAMDVKLGLGLVTASVCLLVAVLAWPVLKTSPTARFWLLMMLFAAAPSGAVAKTHGRLLFYVGIGGAALMAEYVCYVMRSIDWQQHVGALKRWSTKIVAYYFIVFHIVLGTLVSVSVGLSYLRIHVADLDPMHLALERATRVDMRYLTGWNLILVTNPSPHATMFIPYIGTFYDKGIHETMRTLAPAFNAVKVTRTDEREITVEGVEGPLPVYPSAPLFNGDKASKWFSNALLNSAMRGDQPFELTRYDFPEMWLEVADLQAGYPTNIRVEIKPDVNLKTLRWLYWSWDKKRYETFVLPPLGESVVIDGPVEHRR